MSKCDNCSIVEILSSSFNLLICELEEYLKYYDIVDKEDIKKIIEKYKLKDG